MPTTNGKNLATSLKKVTSPITNLGKRIIDPALSFRLIDAGPTLKESIQREVPSAAFSPGYFTGTFIDKIYPSDQESKYGALLQNPEASAKSSLSKAL